MNWVIKICMLSLLSYLSCKFSYSSRLHIYWWMIYIFTVHNMTNYATYLKKTTYSIHKDQGQIDPVDKNIPVNKRIEFQKYGECGK